MLCIEIMRNAEDISLEEWNFFLRGSAGLDKQRPVKPSVPWISRQVWNQACDLSDAVPAFRGIYQDLTKTPCWIKLGENLVCCPIQQNRQSAYLMIFDNNQNVISVISS